MKLVVQRVNNASVTVDNKITGKIDKGLMVLVGFGKEDTIEEARILANRLVKLRIFEDDNQRMNLSVMDVKGKLLLVPQFTLYASLKKNRPSFHRALEPAEASKLFDEFVDLCNEKVPVETGVFGAHMDVQLENYGPVTILMEK